MPRPGPSEEHTEAVRALARISRLLERASGELSLAHYRVMAAIASGEERASRLAEGLALGRPTVSASVDALVKRRLITKSPVSADHRASSLTLTKEGESVLAEVEARMVARLDEIALRTEDPSSLVAELVRLGRALDERQAERSR